MEIKCMKQIEKKKKKEEGNYRHEQIRKQVTEENN